MDALQQILRAVRLRADEIESIEVEIAAFLMPTCAVSTTRQTGLEAKYSLEYDLAAIVARRAGGLHQYTDEAVRRPEAQELMKRVNDYPGRDGPLAEPGRAHAEGRRAARRDGEPRRTATPPIR